MRHSLRQMLAMAGVEFQLHWRRRALLVITLSLLVLPTLSAVFVRGELAASGGTATALGPIGRDSTTVAIVYGTWGALYVVLAVLLPPVVAEAIPRDRQLGVRELLDSLPLTAGAYLAGKLLGAWLALAAALGAAMLVIGALWLVLVGRFSPGPYLHLWLVGALGLALINAALGVLLAGTQPNRRRAVLVGVAVSMVVLFFLGTDLQRDSDTARFLLSPARPALFNYYLFGWLEVPPQFGTVVTARHVWLTLLAGAGQCAAIAGALWAWLRWREHRV